MSKLHYEFIESSDRLCFKFGSLYANIEVDDFKWSELTEVITEFILQDELPEAEQSVAYKAYMNGAASIAIARNSNGNLEVIMEDV